MNKKLIALALSVSILGLTACGSSDGSSKGDAPKINFNCPEGYTCTVTDAERGNTDFYSFTGGGAIMGPLVTADAMKDAETMDEAKMKIAQHFQVANTDFLLNSSTAAGNPYVVFDSKNNPGQKTYVELRENGGYFFACHMSTTTESVEEAQTAGESVCSNLQ